MKKILTIFGLLLTSISFSQITISSNLPSNISAGNAIEAEIKIRKGAVGNFAKYQLDVPEGYIVSSVDAKGGNFTFEAQRAKIVWVAVPGEDEFSIKLSIVANSNATSPGTFAQKFYYLENNEKKEIETSPITVTVNNAMAVVTNEEPKAVETVAAVTPTQPKQTETKTTTEEPKAVGKVETVVYDAPVETKSPASTSPKTTTTADVAGMTFKVQIGAYSTQPNKSRFARAGNVNIDNIGGMFKVTTGNFTSKEEAIRFRDELQTKGFSGFIVKYQNGQRIN